jgi:hypothetical protein
MSDISPRTMKQLQMLADRLKDNPDYMAWVFASYQKIERISATNLMQILGTSPTEFSKIALCKRPMAESLNFGQQIKQIANYSNTDPSILANIIHQVDSVQALFLKPEGLSQEERDTSVTQLKAGLLAVARDRSCQGQEQDNKSTSPTIEKDEGRGGDDLVDE